MGQAKRRRDGAAVAVRAPKARITADEAGYLHRVRAQAREAEKLTQQATQLEAQAGELRKQAVALYGAHESYVAHLCDKYGLDKALDGIDPDTWVITRAQAQAPALVELGDPGEPGELVEVVGRPAHGGPTNGLLAGATEES